MSRTFTPRWTAIILAIFVGISPISFAGNVSPASAHTMVPAGLTKCKSNVPMYTREDGGSRHEKYVGMYVPTDVTDRYKNGYAYISYDQGTDHATFTRNSTNPFQMKTRELNLWGVSSSWAFFHQNWRTTNSWWAHYNCSGRA